MTTTPQQRIRELLGAIELPSKQIEVYGSQIVITCRSEETARRWAMIIAKFATVRRAAFKSVDDLKDQSKCKSCMLPAHETVWRTFATI